MGNAIIAIDPGRRKCGLVVLSEEGDLLERKVLDTARLPGELKALLSRYRPRKVLLGGGTYSKNLRTQLKDSLGEVELELRDESYSSEQARKRYFVDHPPRGLKKLIPEGMRVPKEPYDDYAALIMAENYFKEKKQLTVREKTLKSRLAKKGE